MFGSSRKQRFAMFAVSAALVGGGAVLPTTAFAAPAAPQGAQVNASGTVHQDHGKSGQGKKRGGKKIRVQDVQNMPGCKFLQGKVYCEAKPDKPAPNPNPDPAPKPTPDPAAQAKERGESTPASPAPKTDPEGTTTAAE
ncbi:hypothetical protein [Streptomyces sp. NRRL S-87]|uniref:hypothetical protein n=1 Tax=Streptomyces sp. NRRL S-87 TaxID=1463920 RepID=UPI0004BFEDA8|nr:hypothetical protein [Streptomyces sp. NRRL S-87]